MKIYIIKSRDGKYLKTGRSNSNKWRDTIEEATIYQSIGPAKGQVTFWAKHSPEYGVPLILEFTVDENSATILDMSTSVKTHIDKKLNGWKKRLASIPPIQPVYRPYDDGQYVKNKIESLEHANKEIR